MVKLDVKKSEPKYYIMFDDEERTSMGCSFGGIYLRIYDGITNFEVPERYIEEGRVYYSCHIEQRRTISRGKKVLFKEEKTSHLRWFLDNGHNHIEYVGDMSDEEFAEKYDTTIKRDGIELLVVSDITDRKWFLPDISRYISPEQAKYSKLDVRKLKYSRWKRTIEL